MSGQTREYFPAYKPVFIKLKGRIALKQVRRIFCRMHKARRKSQLNSCKYSEVQKVI